MLTRIATAWYWVRSSLWFVPGLMILGAFGLAWASLGLDNAVADGRIKSLHGFYAGSAEGARSLLSTVAGSMITVAGVVFSVTIVALSQASSQFGPRILRNFMRDVGNQSVLGVFLSTFVYCLIVLRTIRTKGETGFVSVPEVSITVGVLLSLVSIGFLVFFIHHVSSSIQVDNIIARIVSGMEQTDAQSWVAGAGNPWKPEGTREPVPSENPGLLRAHANGYIQSLDAASVFECLREQDLVMEFYFRPGDFLTTGKVIGRFWPDKPLPPDFEKRMNRFIIVGSHRTPIQDFGFGVNLLVEIALRALSPGINDPFTALMCLDGLEEILVPLAGKPFASGCRADASGKLRMIDHPPAFPEILDLALDPIRHFGVSNPVIAQRVLGILKMAMERTREPGIIQALSVQARMFAREETWAEAEDREKVRLCYAAFLVSRNAAMAM